MADRVDSRRSILARSAPSSRVTASSRPRFHQLRTALLLLVSGGGNSKTEAQEANGQQHQKGNGQFEPPAHQADVQTAAP